MRKTIEVGLATVILALCITKAAGAPIEGTWEGTINGQKAITLTIASTTELHGTMILYVVDTKFGEPGARVVGQDERPLRNVKWDGKTLHFSIKDPDVDYEMTLTGQDQGVIKQHSKGNIPEATMQVHRQ